MIYPNTFDKLYIGPSGNPEDAPVEDGQAAVIEWCHEQGWQTLELAFVHNVYLKEQEAEQVALVSKQLGFPISAHGSYYINLASLEPQKIGASRSRIVQAAQRVMQAGGHSVVYHSAFYTKRDSAEVTPIVLEQTKKVQEEMKERGLKAWLRPELTGKQTQHGDIPELIKVANSVEMALPCIDWAHLLARYNGEINSYDQWCSALDQLDRGIRNKNILQRMHMHISGIEYGPKGEKRHIPLATADLRYKELMQALKQAGVTGTLIVEAPRISLSEDIARLMEAWESA